MVAIPFIKAAIRPLVMKKDLRNVADLIESCFALQHDMDGQAFLKQMRQAYRISNFIGEPELWSENDATLVPGFVWEEWGSLMGNVSIIPFRHHGKKIYLIANVAVLPQFRRKGIGKALTQHAISYLRGRGCEAIWLQVKQENSAAVGLYHGLGFVDQCCRSTWRRLPSARGVQDVALRGNFQLSRRETNDWQDQNSWLQNLYPDEIIWHYPVWLGDFSPEVFWNPDRWEYALKLRHWRMVRDEKVQGFITWQRTSTFADNLWLAPDPSVDISTCVEMVLALLPGRVGRRKPLSLDLPYGMAVEPLLSAQFELFRSLIWMRLS